MGRGQGYRGGKPLLEKTGGGRIGAKNGYREGDELRQRDTLRVRWREPDRAADQGERLATESSWSGEEISTVAESSP